LAVTVTVCAVAKFDGVNVSVAGDSVSPVLPDEAIVTVSFEDGAWDRASVNVAVCAWATDKVAGLAVIDPGGGVVLPAGVQVAVTLWLLPWLVSLKLALTPVALAPGARLPL
jgi:hypothetical protein